MKLKYNIELDKIVSYQLKNHLLVYDYAKKIMYIYIYIYGLLDSETSAQI